MSLEKIFEEYRDIDNIIESSTEMDDANSPIKIYEGNFKLKDETSDIDIIGFIQYEWFPRSGAIFRGHAIAESTDMIGIITKLNMVQVIIEGQDFGNAYITGFNLSDKIYLKGELCETAIVGDDKIPVEKINFSIPNLVEFHGTTVKRITKEKYSLLNNRIKLENDKYLITIDKRFNFKDISESLEEKGGYSILYNGEIISRKGSITYNETKDIFFSLSIFLNFINGRRTSAIFKQGIFENEIIWKDFSDFHIDLHNFSPSCVPQNSADILNMLWQKFSALWNNKVNRDFLITSIHWYIESNKGSGFSEGALIMAQTALELIYNWYIVEHKKMILGKDSENINAANKIRLLLSQLKINLNIPEKFSSLKDFISSSANIIDAPDAVVQIRNAIVHSQEEKRKKLSDITFRAKNEALQLCIWYIEMSLLKIFAYNGVYINRCSKELAKSKRQELVPWAKA